MISNTLLPCEAAVENAIRWLVGSGVQVVSDNPQHDGGFACWYEADTGQMPYVYSEITGYLLTFLCNYWEEAGVRIYLISASRAGDWLCRTVHPATGGFRCLFPLYPSRFEYKYGQIYTFDCGVILNGLVRLYRATENPQYLTAARAVGDWLVDHAQQADGRFQPLYEIEKGEFHTPGVEWSLASGSYHTKIAIGLACLYDAVKDQRYLQAATRVCDFALSFQQPDGRFITFRDNDGTNSHPHAYSAEGLWVLGQYLKREDYLQASAKATGWLLSLQSQEGYIPRHFQAGQPLYTERVDILAQTLRLAVIHLAEGRLSGDIQPKLEKLIALILRNQASSTDARVNGAFYFGRLSNGETVPHANVWVTAFAAQALGLYVAWQKGRYRLNPFSMI